MALLMYFRKGISAAKQSQEKLENTQEKERLLARAAYLLQGNLPKSTLMCIGYATLIIFANYLWEIRMGFSKDVTYVDSIALITFQICRMVQCPSWIWAYHQGNCRTTKVLTNYLSHSILSGPLLRRMLLSSLPPISPWEKRTSIGWSRPEEERSCNVTRSWNQITFLVCASFKPWY